MDIFKYVETVLGRELTVLERRVVRNVMTDRRMFPEPMKSPPDRYSIPDKARWEKLAPIVDKYLEERANA